ncbi:MAG: CapA family protein [bacterium]
MKNITIFCLVILIVQGCTTAQVKLGTRGSSTIEVNDEALKATGTLGTVDMILAGDVMLGRRLEPLIEKSGVNYPFTGIADSIKKYPIIFCNLEAPFIYENNINTLKKNGNKTIYLYAEESIAKGFKVAGFNVLSLANNHALDYGQDGVIQTMEILDRQGIKYGGIKIGDLSLPNEPIIIDYNGVKVGFLCYSRVSGKNSASSFTKYGTIPGTYKVIKRDVKNARPKVDILIVYMHWGIEGREVQKRQRTLGHGIINLGVDMVIGSHTHIFQDIEKYNGHYIFYGLGNFIFDMRDDQSKSSAFVKVKVENKKIKEVKIEPVYLQDFRPEIMTDKAEIEKFLDTIKLNNVKLEEIYPLIK